MKAFKKVAVIGLDCALTGMIDKHIAEGVLPNFKRLFEAGTVCDNALVPYPTITPPNWATLATGAWPGTHGITDFWVHDPGTTPTSDNALCAFNSKWFQAETIWEAGERAGKKSIIFNYPGSWPSKLKNGIVVGGRGLAIGLVYDGHKHLDKDIVLAGDMLFTTDSKYGSVKVAFADAKGWSGLDAMGDDPQNAMGDDPLEAVVKPNFPHTLSTIEDTTWYLLVRDTAGKGYDTVTLSPNRNMADAFFTIKTGEWSPKVFTNLNADGTAKEVFFNAKLMRLSDDAEDFALYMNPLIATKGWSSPENIDDLIRDVPGSPGNSGGYLAYHLGWIDPDTWVDINYQHTDYNASIAERLMKTQEWDIFYMHNHPPDWAYHMLMTDLDKRTAASEEAYELAWRLHREMCIATDKLVGRVLDTVDDDTCVVLVSDHGAVMDGPTVDPNDILEKAGLIEFEPMEELDLAGENKNAAMLKRLYGRKPDLTKTRAMLKRPYRQAQRRPHPPRAQARTCRGSG